MSVTKDIFVNEKNNLRRGKLGRNLILMAAATIAGASATPQTPFGFLPEAEADALLAGGNALVELNKSVRDAGGNVAVHATTLGVSAAQAIEAETKAPKVEVAKQEFQIETGIAVPEIKRGGPGATKYPFDKMQAGDSFFVGVSEAMPNPSKTLASTVNSANKRYKDATPKRKFAIRQDEKAGVKGARIWRTE